MFLVHLKASNATFNATNVLVLYWNPVIVTLLFTTVKGEWVKTVATTVSEALSLHEKKTTTKAWRKQQP